MIICNLNRVYYPVKTLGYGNRIGFWLQGCCRRCEECMSPEMQDPNVNHKVDVDILLSKIPIGIKPDGLTISGGEPFDQPEAVKEIISWYISRYNLDVLIYTGYFYQDLCSMPEPSIKWILRNVAAIVDGPYIRDLNDGVGLRGSSNQTLHVFRYSERYDSFLEQTRKMQCIQEKDRLFLIGLLPKSRGELNG